MLKIFYHTPKKTLSPPPPFHPFFLDAGCGLGVALNLAKILYKEKVETYGVDIIEWAKNDIAQKELGRLEKQYGKKIVSSLLDSKRFNFIKGDIKTVLLPEKMDLITAFFVLQYHDDPLGAWTNLFNQLSNG